MDQSFPPEVLDPPEVVAPAVFFVAPSPPPEVVAPDDSAFAAFL
ncbi:MAG: hypothetical protein N2652_09565 [Kiritimatiellae bacterium]|nr:hypothetical protein [Kiritimatiellia bacterium]